MKTIGLFEAKTKFSEICEKVAAKGVPVLVTRRGKPLVRIDPVHPHNSKPQSVWDVRADYLRTHGSQTEDFDLPKREKQTWRHPLQDE
jgi:prevent-host-death family protein